MHIICQLNIWDVFLLDSDFVIERPKRYYRHGFHLLHSDTANGSMSGKSRKQLQITQADDHLSLIGTIKSKVSEIFHIDGHQRAATTNDALESGDGRDSSSSSITSEPPPPMLDPSTNANPLSGVPEHPGTSSTINDKGQKKRSSDVSKHTFYIVNSQMRLKLFAHNEVWRIFF
jgi:phospholipase D1/2